MESRIRGEVSNSDADENWQVLCTFLNRMANANGKRKQTRNKELMLMGRKKNDFKFGGSARR